MTSSFSAEGCPIWIKFRRLVQNDMSTCGDIVKIETRCRFPIWRTFGRIPWHVIPQPPATLHMAKSMSWSCHIAECNNSIRHIVDRFSPYFIYFIFFKCSLGNDERRLSYRLRYTCYFVEANYWRTGTKHHAASLQRRNKCLFVCRPSVTRRYSVETAKHPLTFSPLGTHTILTPFEFRTKR